MADTDLFLQLDQKAKRSPTAKGADSVVVKSPARPGRRPQKAVPGNRASRETGIEARKEGSEEVKKYTSKLVSQPSDPPINKVGYYLTRREMDHLDALWMKLKPILRDKHSLKVTKNDIIRACLAKGLADWEENQLASELVYLLTSKSV